MAPHIKKTILLVLAAGTGLFGGLALVIHYNPPDPFLPVGLEEIIESPRDFGDVSVKAWLEPGYFGLMQVRAPSIEFDPERPERGFVIAHQNGEVTSGVWGTLYPLNADIQSSPGPVQGFKLFYPGTHQIESGLYQIKGRVCYTQQRVFVLVVHSLTGPQ